MQARFLPQCLYDVALAHTAPTDQNEISTAADEIAGGQFFDLHPIEGLRIELPVETFQGFTLRKVRVPNAPRHRALAPCVGLCAQQQIEKTQVREALLLGPREQFIQSC